MHVAVAGIVGKDLNLIMGDGGQYVLELAARSLFQRVCVTSVLRLEADSNAGCRLCLWGGCKLGTSKNSGKYCRLAGCSSVMR